MAEKKSFQETSCDALCSFLGPFGPPLARRAFWATALVLLTVRKALFLAAGNWEWFAEWLFPGITQAEQDSTAALLLLLLSGFCGLVALGAYIVPYCVACYRRLRYLGAGAFLAFVASSLATWLVLSPGMAEGIVFRPQFYILEASVLLALAPWPDRSNNAQDAG